MAPRNVVLIGLPATGKSTVGSAVAAILGRAFVDTDARMVQAAGMDLDAYWEQHGVASFRALEEQVVCELRTEPSIIATGGSVIYSAPAMARLKELGTVVYLELAEAEWQKRYAAAPPRRVVVPDGMTWEAMIAERVRLYADFADIIVDATGTADEVVHRVMVAIGCPPRTMVATI